MPAYLHSLAGAVPATAYDQGQILDIMRRWHGEDRKVQRLLTSIYRGSAISRRHSVVNDFLPGAEGGFFLDPDSGDFRSPSTGERNRFYAREAGELSACAAGKALSRAKGFSREQVTHLITVSCTGFYAPGTDIELVDRLELSPSVERYHIGFMGCYGAFPAMRLARSLTESDPSAVALVVSVELCTLHLQADSDVDSLLAASVFADGAAAALVSSREPRERALRMDGFASALAPAAAGEMAWTIGDSGFEMVLSSGLPGIVEAEVGEALRPLFDAAPIGPEEVPLWAVHPGGRAILDSVEGAMQLEPGALAHSRAVLDEYGNMSSATVLFVLERILGASTEGTPVAAVAFGPGLSVESARFTRVG